MRGLALNEKLLEQAKGKVDDVRVLINGASKRAAELARGARPLLPLTPGEEVDFLDLALEEIAEGKLVLSLKEQ
jgi:DNA-directed RNA polymerase subunit K/omega